MTKYEFLEKFGLELGIPAEKLTDDAVLSSFLAWDSMGQVATVALLNTELGFEAPQGALQRCVTVGDLVAMAAPCLTG
jgi:acyl carrier protein